MEEKEANEFTGKNLKKALLKEADWTEKAAKKTLKEKKKVKDAA